MGVTYSQDAVAALTGSRQQAQGGGETHGSGGKRNKPPRHWREFVKQASRWNLADLKRARARFATLYEETSTFLVGRRQFWEVFTDYDFSLVKNGEFLALPLDIFAYFEQEESGIVDLREVFCLLALVAQGTTTSERLELCFPLFGPSMTEERIAQLLLTMQRGLFRLGVLVKRSPPAFVMQLAGRICGEGAWRKCQTVSAQLLGDWLASNEDVQAIASIVLAAEKNKASQYSLLRSNADIKNAGTIMKREARKLVNAMSAPDAGNGGRTTALGAVRQTNTRQRGSVVDGRQTNVAGKSPILGVASAMPGGARASVTQSAPIGHAREAALAAANERRASIAEAEAKIGNALTKEDLEDMCATEDAEAAAAIAKFETRDLVALRKSWTNAKSTKKGLTKDQFSSVMHTQFPSITSPAVLARMFVLFDRDRDGMINFDEFIIGVSRLTSASLEEKARFLFDVANAANPTQAVSKIKAGGRATTAVTQPQNLESDNGSGGDVAATNSASRDAADTSTREAARKAAAALQKPENERSMRLVDLVKLVQDTNNELMECAHLVELIITMMDYDKNGSVEKHEFERAVAEIPSILSSFDECLKPPEDLAVWTIKLFRAVPHFGIESILNAWRRLGRNRDQFCFVNWERFVYFIEPFWEGSAFSPKDTMTSRSHSYFDFTDRSQADLSMDVATTSDELVYTVLLNLFRVALITCPARDVEDGLVIPGEEEVDLRKMLIGMALALERSRTFDTEDPAHIQAKGELYFELFDSDCSKSVDYQEFFEFLYASQLSMQDTGWKAIELLRSLDINHDGVVTFSEFMEAVRANKDILYCFGRIFHASVVEGPDDELAKTSSEDASSNAGDGNEDPLGEEAQEASENPEVKPKTPDEASNGSEDSNSSSNNSSNNQCSNNNNSDEEEGEERQQSNINNSNNDPSDAESKNEDSSTKTLGQSASAPAGIRRNKPQLSLSTSASTPALPLDRVYRTTYHFEKKAEAPPSPSVETIAPLPSVRRKTSKAGSMMNRKSPTARDLKSPKSPGTARSSISTNSHRGRSLNPL